MNDQDSDDQIDVLISAIEHYSYCPRQCALIHVEQVYEDNVHTVRGTLAHERVHSGDDTPLRGVEVRRGMPLASQELGLVGKADLVELRAEGPYPVEYKSGRAQEHHAKLQLCAQAMCLEKMFGRPVRLGAIYHHATRSRSEVCLDDQLRRETLAVIDAIRDMLGRQEVPPPLAGARCRECSLADICLPKVTSDKARLRGFQSALFRVYD